MEDDVLVGMDSEVEDGFDDVPFDVQSVEEAPASNIDLDALLAMGDIEIGGDSESKTKVVKREVLVDADTDEPHISVPTRRFAEVLAVSSLISGAGENSFEGKSIAMKISDGTVSFLLSDNKRNVEKSVPLFNQDNRFEGFIAFSASVLSRMVKVCPSVFTIIERKGDDGKKKYVLVVRGGEIALDSMNMDESKFVKSYQPVNPSNHSRVDTMRVIRRLYPFAATAMRLGKSIDFVGNIVQSSPINSLAKVQFDDEYPKFRLTLTDAKILLLLCSQDDSETIQFSSDGKVFEGNGFKFKTESLTVSSSSFDSVAESMFEGQMVVADLKHMAQITDLSCSLDTSIGNLRFNFTDSGYLQAALLTKRESSVLDIQSEANPGVTPLENGIDIPSFNLKSALVIFSGETVGVRLSVNGLALQSTDDGGRIRVAILGKEPKKK